MLEGHETGSELYTVETDTHELFRLFSSAPSEAPAQGIGWIISPPAWSWDGRRLAFLHIENHDEVGRTKGLTLYTISPDGSDLREVIRLDDVNRGLEGVVDWSPNGKDLLFSWSQQNSSSKGSIYVVNLDGSNLREIGTGIWVSWSPDGSRIAVAYQEYNGAIQDLSTMAPDGSDVKLLLWGRREEKITRKEYLEYRDGGG